MMTVRKSGSASSSTMKPEEASRRNRGRCHSPLSRPLACSGHSESPPWPWTKLEFQRVHLTYSPSFSLNANGQDKLGNPILYQQIYLAKDLEKWQSRVEQGMDLTEQESKDIDVNLDYLSWTLFALSSLTLINLERSQPLKPPKRPKPAASHEGLGEIQTWHPYPQPSHPYAFHAGCHFHAFLSLSEKVMRDEELFTSKNQSDKVMDRFGEIYHELETWPDNLPDCMKLGPRSTPHVLALQ